MDIILLIPIACLFGLIPAKIAKNKGRKFELWWLYGSCLFIIAFIHSLLLKDDENKNVIKINGQKEMQQYSTNLPLVVTKYSFTNKENNLYLNVTFGNMSSMNISSVKMNIYGFNSFEEKININGLDYFQLLLQDMKLEPKTTKTYTINTPLPNSDIRKVKIIPYNVLMEDNSIITANIVDFNIQKNLSDNNKYIPIENDKYWLCSCGYINSIENEKCNYCVSYKNNIFNNTMLKTHVSKNENFEQKMKNDKYKTKKILIVSTVLIILFLALIVSFLNIKSLFYKDNEMYVFLNEINYILDLNKHDLENYINDDNSKLLNQSLFECNDIKLYKYDDEMIAVSILDKITDNDFLNLVNRIYDFNNENKKINTVNDKGNIISITLDKYDIDLYVSFNQLDQLNLIFSRTK